MQIFIQRVWVGPEILYLQPVPSSSSQAAGPWSTGGRARSLGEKRRLVTKRAEMVGGFQYECVISGKWIILTHRAQKFSRLLGFVSNTFEKVGHLAWITCLDHLWAFPKVSLPDFQHKHGLLPVRHDCFSRDAVWQAPGYKSESLALSQVMLTKASVLEVSSSHFQHENPKA